MKKPQQVKEEWRRRFPLSHSNASGKILARVINHFTAANFRVISAAFDAPCLLSRTPQDFEGLFRESETHSSGSSGNNIIKGWVAVTASSTTERQILLFLRWRYYLLFEIETVPGDTFPRKFISIHPNVDIMIWHCYGGHGNHCVRPYAEIFILGAHARVCVR